MSGLKETNLYLKSSTQVHPYPFVGSEVELSVSLCSDSGRTVPGVNVPFQVVMKRKDDAASSSSFTDSIQILNEEPLEVCESTGEARAVKIQFMQCSLHSNMVLAVIPTDCSQTNIASSSTNPFQVIQSRLEIFNERQIETPWFKDEGGNQNQIELVVRLVNSGMMTDLTRASMKLRCFVTYENGEVAKEAEKRPKKVTKKVTKDVTPKKTQAKKDEPLFAVSPDTKLYLDDTGYCHIKCRIGQVSQNHNQKNFKIWVAPDLHQASRLNYDVSPASTPAITVKSKISKRNREERNLPAPAGAKRCKATDKTTHDVQCISPANVSESRHCHNGGVGGINVDVEALLQFSTTTLVRLQKLQRQHEQLKMLQRQGQAAPGNQSVETMPTVYELLGLYEQLRLPPPSPSFFHSQSELSKEDSAMSESEDNESEDSESEESESEESDTTGYDLIPDIGAPGGVPAPIVSEPPFSVPAPPPSKQGFTVATRPTFQFVQHTQPIKSAVPRLPVQSIKSAVPRLPVQSIKSAVPMVAVQSIKSAVPMVAVQPVQTANPTIPVQPVQSMVMAYNQPRGELKGPGPKREPSIFTQQARYIANYGQGSLDHIRAPVEGMGGGHLGPEPSREFSCESVDDLNDVDPNKHFA